ncbi:hypothetical protein Cs7R123_20340 [Catellatospora sp. TT07R-123]|uniref:hypothetical protein n=1 Tax=Catellatospora sp. TT07R-123 TaxID=2733863 RepID=UPI001B159CFF|nr:hypothetical protein [Catellatospora sp. TT07R-123]GHJ44692.1 hypothetical protein Cs7R123_20340 [Catellatospora sp. TT07R-123]
MSAQVRSGLFIAEGTSDLPIAEIVESIFLDFDTMVHLSKPDFSLLTGVKKDVGSRVSAGVQLLRGTPLDLVVVHRDADNAGYQARRDEIDKAVSEELMAETVAVIPVRMTEAWLLLSEEEIRIVAGNPRSRKELSLPQIHEVERLADPKTTLQQCLLKAADVTGRRRDAMAKRFNQHRRQLLERLDRSGPVSALPSWRQLVRDIGATAERWKQVDR